MSVTETPFLGRLRVRDFITAVLVYFVGSNTNHKGFPMKKKNWQFLSGLCAIVMAGAWAAPGRWRPSAEGPFC
jgi:hypothetical protein